MNRVLALVVVCLAVASCSSDGTQTNPSITTASTVATVATTVGQTTTTVPPTSTVASSTSTQASTSTSTTSIVTPTTTVTTTRPSCDLAGFSLGAKRNDVIPPAIASLTSVRAGQHDCYERIVFDFKDDNVPEYEIAYGAPPFSGPSGIPIAVAGTRFIKVRFGTTYARYPGFGSYDGPDVVKPAGFNVINEIHLIEEFEAVVVWVIGIDAEHVFRVGTLTNPTRIYVDVARG